MSTNTEEDRDDSTAVISVYGIFVVAILITMTCLHLSIMRAQAVNTQLFLQTMELHRSLR